MLELGDRQLGGWGIALGIINILAAIAIAVALWTNPAVALGAFIWVAAIYGIVFGIVAVIAAFKVRNA